MTTVTLPFADLVFLLDLAQLGAFDDLDDRIRRLRQRLELQDSMLQMQYETTEELCKRVAALESGRAELMRITERQREQLLGQDAAIGELERRLAQPPRYTPLRKRWLSDDHAR